MQISELILKPHKPYDKYGPEMIIMYAPGNDVPYGMTYIDVFHPGHVYDLLRQGKSVKVKLTQVEVLTDEM